MLSYPSEIIPHFQDVDTWVQRGEVRDSAAEQGQGSLTPLPNALSTYSLKEASGSTAGLQKLFDATDGEGTNSFLMHQ